MCWFVAQVIAFNCTIAGSLVMQGIETLSSLPDVPEQVPAVYLFSSALAWVLLTLFVILRSPFRLTTDIGLLNETLAERDARSASPEPDEPPV